MDSIVSYVIKPVIHLTPYTLKKAENKTLPLIVYNIDSEKETKS
jgi:hypothetical protein